MTDLSIYQSENPLALHLVASTENGARFLRDAIRGWEEGPGVPVEIDRARSLQLAELATGAGLDVVREDRTLPPVPRGAALPHVMDPNVTNEELIAAGIPPGLRTQALGRAMRPLAAVPGRAPPVVLDYAGEHRVMGFDFATRPPSTAHVSVTMGEDSKPKYTPVMPVGRIVFDPIKPSDAPQWDTHTSRFPAPTSEELLAEYRLAYPTITKVWGDPLPAEDLAEAVRRVAEEILAAPEPNPFPTPPRIIRVIREALEGTLYSPHTNEPGEGDTLVDFVRNTWVGEDTNEIFSRAAINVYQALVALKK